MHKTDLAVITYHLYQTLFFNQNKVYVIRFHLYT